jgi:hypothetical protein
MIFRIVRPVEEQHGGELDGAPAGAFQRDVEVLVVLFFRVSLFLRVSA